MTAFFAELFDLKNSDPSNRESFFNGKEDKIVRDYINRRECVAQTFPPSCDVNLFFGFFFDGTNNNMQRDRRPHNMSNVARLYTAFPGGRDNHGSEAWPDLQSKYYGYFRTYIPGVGTPFKEVGDSGKGFTLRDDRPKGLGFCYLGENRIIWALVQAVNNLHRYYAREVLISDDEFLAIFNKLHLPSFADSHYPSRQSEDGRQSNMELLEAKFTALLQQLHRSLQQYLPVGPGKSKDHGVVTNIFVSMFGFSRGATKTRAFTNWFIWLCRLDARLCGRTGLTLGSVPVTIDFVGLFDTVASVGLAASALVTDGHQAWADAEHSLKIPAEPVQCLHLVSAHEIRRSFPLDSVMQSQHLPANCREIVFPGVHSDVGGGYGPLEQGRGKDPEGHDLLSRIPLAVMYRAARLAGVPLKLESAPEVVKRAFQVGQDTIRTFNAYIDACRRQRSVAEGELLSDKLHLLMETQHKLYIQWRKTMVGKMADLPNIKDSNDKHAREDILAADAELKEEIRYFENWRGQSYGGDIERRPSIPEWEVIDAWWDEPVPPTAITDLFEQYVHDSRAAFKPLGRDLTDLQHEMDMLVERGDRAREWAASHPYDSKRNPYALSTDEQRKVDRYRPYQGKSNFSEGIEPAPKGREPLWLGGGFLRYRKIYMGSDGFKPTGAHYAGVVPLEENDRRLAKHSDTETVGA